MQSESRENKGHRHRESVRSERGHSHRECAIWIKIVVNVREWEQGPQSRKGECGWRGMSESEWGVGREWQERPRVERKEGGLSCRSWNSLIFVRFSIYLFSIY